MVWPYPPALVILRCRRNPRPRILHPNHSAICLRMEAPTDARRQSAFDRCSDTVQPLLAPIHHITGMVVKSTYDAALW